MWKWDWKRVTWFFWLFFFGILLRIIFLKAWNMETQEAQYAIIAAGASLICAILLSIACRVSKTLREHTRQIQQEEAEKAARKVVEKKAEKESNKELKLLGFRVLPLVWYLFMGGFASLLWFVVIPQITSPPEPPPTIYFSEFLTRVEGGLVDDVFITPREGGTREIIGKYSADHKAFRVVDPGGYSDLIPFLRKHNVKILSEHAIRPSLLYSLFISAWPMLLLIGVWIYFMRKASGMGGGGFSSSTAFMKSLHHKSDDGDKKITFADVAGADEAKEELAEIVEFLKNPGKFSKLGARVPKGVLLIGPPGCGKTLLARAVAGEANVPFLQTSGSEFVQMFVGVGASRVRDLFEEGKKCAPCIIFIDEIDAVGKQRGTGLGGGNDEREQTLNQILVAMDGFAQNSGVILLGATNRPDMLDEALRRPGRFDRQVVVDRPDIRGREAILRVHTKEIPLDVGVDLVGIARGTPGFTGADLANLVNEAALLASREDCSAIGIRHLEKAKDKVLSGAERKSMILSDADKKLTAYHEAGHTIVSKLLKQYVDKVTIIPRGQALGVTFIQDTEDRYGRSKAELIDMIRVAMGGRVAEEIVFGADKISTGAGNDLGKATDLAVKMVCELGMSELGPRTFGKREEIMFLGRDVAKQKDYGETTALRIDEEVNRLVHEAYQKAFELISSNRECLERLAQALLVRETLDASEIGEIMRGVGAL